MERKIRMIIKEIIASKKGSFSIEEIRKEMNISLNRNNFRDKAKNEKLTNEYLDNLIINKKLFRYSENDNEYFYIH